MEFDAMQELSVEEAAAAFGGDWTVSRVVGWALGGAGQWMWDQFATPSPEGDFNWARDK